MTGNPSLTTTSDAKLPASKHPYVGLREPEWEDIAALRNKVGMGWRQDAEPRDFKLVYLEDMAALFDRGGLDRLPALAKAEYLDELAREHEAAAAVMDAPYLQTMVRIALTSPKNLRESDRRTLHHYFKRAMESERLPLRHHELGHGAPEYGQHPQPVPVEMLGGSAAGGGLKRGRGNGSGGHRGAYTTGTKRFENKEQVAYQRALRQARQTLRVEVA